MEESTNKKRFCYLTPDFPKRSFAVVVFIDSGNGVRVVFPLSSLHPNRERISESIQEVEAELKKYPKHNPKILEHGIIIPLIFQETYPLKEEFWQQPTKSFPVEDRIRAFSQMILSDQPHLMLVTPSKYEEKLKLWHFSAALPMPITVSNEEIENFMLTSDYPVPTQANAAAIYGMQKPERVIWKELSKSP